MCAMLLMATGCQKQYVKKSSKKQHAVSLQESIARLSDIPDAPLETVALKVVKSEQVPDNLQIFYSFDSLSKRDIKTFYIEEMERLGWQLHFGFDGDEDVLEFVKPSGIVCLVVIRKSSFVITVVKLKDML